MNNILFLITPFNSAGKVATSSSSNIWFEPSNPANDKYGPS